MIYHTMKYSIVANLIVTYGVRDITRTRLYVLTNIAATFSPPTHASSRHA